MPIVDSDIKTYKSINADSDGGAIDTGRLITSGVLNNVFPSLTGAEQLSGGTRYRKVFRRNEHGSLTWTAVKSWIYQQPGNATLSVGWGINHADDNDGLMGNMTAFSASALVAIISDGADTRTVNIEGETTGGLYQTEALVLNGAMQVVGALTFAKVYAAWVSALDASRTVTIRQGAGGTARGTITPNKKICWLWRLSTEIDTEAEGFRRGNIASLGNYGIWLRKVWAANATAGLGFIAAIADNGGS